jgi:hypothetical protein
MKPIRGFASGHCGLLALLLLVPLGGQAQNLEANEPGMQWSITPYLWGSTTKLDLRFRDQDLGFGEIPFDDLLDVLDTAFMVRVEGGKGHWTFFGDLTYLETSDVEQRPVFLVDSDSTKTILDVAAVYWPGGVGSNLSLFGYQYKEAEFQDGDTNLDFTYYWPMLGFDFRF